MIVARGLGAGSAPGAVVASGLCITAESVVGGTHGGAGPKSRGLMGRFIPQKTRPHKFTPPKKKKLQAATRTNKEAPPVAAMTLAELQARRAEFERLSALARQAERLQALLNERQNAFEAEAEALALILMELT